MWLIIVSFLTCFNIGKAKDELDNEIELDDSFDQFGLVMCIQIPILCTELGLN